MPVLPSKPVADPGEGGPRVRRRAGGSKAVRRFLDGLYVSAAWAGAVCVLLICACMLSQALLRLGGTMLRGADDITAWLCAGAALLPLGATFKRGELVRMGIVIDRLGDRAARPLELLALTLCSVFAIFLAHALGTMTYESFVYGDRAQGMLPIPIWIPQVPVALGATVLAIALVDELLRVIAGHLPAYVQAVRARHASGDHSGEI